ncbi:MAG: tetratricopeptide repeat protein [Opitutae bacterium]|nr:tetratricopeptide repeat protein [Opitutae bacterium]
MKSLFLFVTILVSGFFLHTHGQEAPNAAPVQEKSLEDVIEGIDALLDDIESSAGSESSPAPVPLSIAPPQEYVPPVIPVDKGGDQSFRLKNELVPDNLLNRVGVTPPSPTSTPLPNTGALTVPDPLPLSPAPPVRKSVRPEKPVGSTGQFSPMSKVDYTNATLEDLLREVDLLELPEFVSPIRSPSPSQDLERPLPSRTTESLDPVEIVESGVLSQRPEDRKPTEIGQYTVLGERIDEELKAKILEAIMHTRHASGGTNQPWVTRSVFKANSYCNRVLGRLNAPHHKRYRRDILLSLIGMHERNQAWVDAAKTYERYLEEFASDDRYPFEDHEDAPGIPDLKASLGSVTKWLEGRKRGAPTIPETHIRLGKIYRTLGAHRMALNKFYNAINATLTLPRNEAFELAEKQKGKRLEIRSDAESNQAMFEIAETFMDAEDYDNATKFFSRLFKLEQLEDTDRGFVQFKQGLAHYRRARETLRKLEKINRLPPEQRTEIELEFDKTPRADFAKVKEVLRAYGTLYPQSPYVPEAHYLLALTYEQLGQDEESVKELLLLLRESDFNPEMILNLEQGRSVRDRDEVTIRKLKGVWSFWKKKTGNYLANKFFEDSEYFNAYRIYSALRDIDSSPSWQVPVLYQIALCEEKLGNYVQAMETYSSIEEYVNSEEAREGMANNKYLNFVFGMAKWRREQLEDTRAIRQAVNRYGIYTRAENAEDE